MYLAGGSIASLVLLAVFPVQAYVVGISMSLEKWCSITLLVQLNSRAKQYDHDINDFEPAPTQIESALFQDTWLSSRTLSRRPSEAGKRMNEVVDELELGEQTGSRAVRPILRSSVTLL